MTNQLQALHTPYSDTTRRTGHPKYSSPFGSGLISVSISSTPSSGVGAAIDVLPAPFPASTVFRAQPTPAVAETPSGAGATLIKLFLCFPKENSLFLQWWTLEVDRFVGDGATEAAVDLEAGVLLAATPILATFAKESFLNLAQHE